MTLLLNELVRILVFVWEALVHVWPLLLITIPVAVLIKEVDASAKISSIFRKNIWLSIVIATLVGAIAPFCSCGVIPVISAMLISGVPLAPVMSFWLASPSMDPEIFFLSVASLGWPLAAARMLTTFCMSITGGIITHLLFRKADTSKFLLLQKQEEASCGECCGCTSPQSRIRSLFKNIFDSAWFVVKFLLIAYILEALIIFYVPSDVVVTLLGKNPFLSVLLATLIGVPFYTTNLSALGLMGGLLAKGLSEGAALAFLVGGATTTIPAMAAVYKLVDRRIFAVYIGVTLFFAVASGFLYTIAEELAWL